ncbi:MAG TPA: BACON domain-containing carbohydrate-binding protein [Bryobacterales bacterium]|nr:BACON domain-containing carbohydrate-binding protein [Bryobacterales bacterium]
MKTLTLFLAAVGMFAGISAGAETGTAADQSACKPGGFKLLTFGTVEASGKAGASFNVLFDAANYRSNDFDSALRSAMSTWSTVSGSRWQYQFYGYLNGTPSSGDGQMEIAKGGYSFPSGVLATTLTSAIASTGQIVDSDTFFNPAVSFSANPGPGDFDFQTVALHEMGHGLGLDHNDGCYAVPTVMQSSIGAGVQRRSLFPPETAGVGYLYPGSGGVGTGGNGIAISPSAVSFSALAGGAAPPPQSLSLSVPAGMAWAASVSAGGNNWLSVTPASGTGPATLTVTVTVDGLSAGFYSAQIVVSAGGALSSATISLNLTGVNVTPATLSFSAVAGGAIPAPQNVSLTGGAGLGWRATISAAAASNWIALSSSAGNFPALVSVFVSPAGLAPGVYSAQITFSAGGVSRQVAVQLTVTGQPQIQASPAQISLAGPAASSVPLCASVTISGTNGAALDWSAASTASWLSVSPASGRSPSSLGLCVSAAGLAPGNYSTLVTVTASGPGGSQVITVAFTATPTVSINDGGVSNAASFAPSQPVAGGELLTIFGLNLASQTASAAGFPLPTDLGGARVLLGGIPARLIYVSPGQINLVAPAALADVAGSTTTLTVFNGLQASPAVRVAVATQAPGIFTLLSNGAGAGAVTHNDGTLVGRAAPLAPGEAFSVYVTGIGPLDRTLADGDPAPADPLARAINSVRLLLDGQDARVLFAGAAPGFAGLGQIVATAPNPLPQRFPEIVVQVAGTASNKVTAGGPTLLDVSPAVVRPGADATVILRGINLSPSSAVAAAGVTLPATFQQADWQTLQVTIPASLLAAPGALALAAIDPASPAEPSSNTVVLRVGSN